MLFHISFKSDLPTIIDPKRADGIYEDEPLYEEEVYPEPDIPRFSCSPSIVQCFQAVYPNVKNFFDLEHYPHLDFYVYSPELTKNTKLLTPEELTKKRTVHDAFVTKEHAILSSVKITKVAKIRIKNISKVEKIYYHPFNDPKEPKDSWVPGGFGYTTLKLYGAFTPSRV